MANFCTNCGNKLGKDDIFCTNCGSETDVGHSTDSLEKSRAKKELKRVVGGRLIYNNSFGDELLKNDLEIIPDGKRIRQQVEKEIDSGQIKSGGVEFRVNQLIQEYKIKKEEELIRIEKEKPKITKKRKKSKLITEKERKSKKIDENEVTYGGYCNLSCRHCYEAYFDSNGGLIGDIDGEGYTEYHCQLGHSIAYGSFCEYYE